MGTVIGWALMVAVCSDSVGAETAAESTEAASSDNALETITVTARKRVESFMNVPVAASVISGQMLENQNIHDIESIGNLSPAVVLVPTTGMAGGSLTIRGIGSAGVDTGTEQTVATNIDGVQASRGNLMRLGMLDLDQAEILKGPQALFFGKNSPGGVLSLRSQLPGDKFEFMTRAGYEFRADERQIEAMVSGPLTETLLARFAIQASQMDGWTQNVAGPIANPGAAIPGEPALLPGAGYNYNGSKNVVGRATLLFKPFDDLTATLRVLSGATDDDGIDAGVEMTHCANAVPYYKNRPDPYGDCAINNRTSSGALPQIVAQSDPNYRDGRQYGVFGTALTSLSLDYTRGPLTFDSVTGLLNYNVTNFNNAATNVFIESYSGFIEHYRQWSEELRLASNFAGPVNFTAGAYFEDTKLRSDFEDVLANLPQDPTTGRRDGLASTYAATGRTYSGFGQLSWKLLDSLTLTGGARYTREKRTGFLEDTYVHPLIGFLLPQGVGVAGENTFTNTSPEATITWNANSDLMVYGAYKTGFKSGGFARPVLITPNFKTGADFEYKPEKVHGGEIGSKATLLNGSLRLTMAVYEYDYKDLQVSNFIASQLRQEVANAGGLNTRGIEAELAWRVTHQLTLNTGLGYSHARFTSFDSITCAATDPPTANCDVATGKQNLSGYQPARAPDWTATAGFTYETAISSLLRIGLSADARYSDSYFTQDNISPFAHQGAYATIDAAARLMTMEDHWELAVIGKNLTDRRYVLFSFDNPSGAPGDVASLINRPREVMLSAMYRY